MYLRPAAEHTIGTLKTALREQDGDLINRDVAASEVQFRLDADTPSIVVGDREVPADEKGLTAFSDYFGIPNSYFKRLGKSLGMDAQQYLLQRHLETHSGSAFGVTLSDLGQDGGFLRGLYEPGKPPMDRARLLTVAAKVLGTDEAPIERLNESITDFSFDVRVPEDYDRGVGGDQGVTLEHTMRGKQVGDITAGGLRMGVNLKQGLAPWVEPWTYRLWCTNGCGHVDQGLRIDARGQTVDEVLAELEAKAEAAFSRVEGLIEHFYNLRNQPVPNPERAIVTLAAERGIPDRSMSALLREARGEDLPDEPTMFDVVNLVTNFANSPAVTRDGGRLLLERAGGAVVADEAARCSHCHQRVAH